MKLIISWSQDGLDAGHKNMIVHVDDPGEGDNVQAYEQDACRMVRDSVSQITGHTPIVEVLRD